MSSTDNDITDFECDVCEWLTSRLQAPFDPTLDRCYKCQHEEGYPGEAEPHKVHRSERTCTTCPSKYWCTDYQYELFERQCYTCFHARKKIDALRYGGMKPPTTTEARIEMIRSRKSLREIQDHIDGLAAIDRVAGSALPTDVRDLIKSTQKALKNGYNALHAAINKIDETARMVNEQSKNAWAIAFPPKQEAEDANEPVNECAVTSAEVNAKTVHMLGYTSHQIRSLSALVGVTASGKEVFRFPLDVDPKETVRVIIDLQG